MVADNIHFAKKQTPLASQYFSEFLQTHIRKKYYNFMNDIQTEVNFSEWFDKYYKSKILNDRTTKNLLQK